MRLVFATHCAWRAIYCKTATGFQFFHIGIDPNDAVHPALFGAINVRSRNWEPGQRSLFYKSWRIRLPVVRWASWYRRPSWFWKRAYRLSSTFWHRFDGRRKYYT